MEVKIKRISLLFLTSIYISLYWYLFYVYTDVYVMYDWYI